MLRHSPIARLLWLFAIALLLVRVGEAHLHLCLDGQQPAAAMHVEDAPTHSGAKVSDDGHNDVDVDLSVSPWVKKVGVDELPTILFASILLALLLPILKSTSPPARLLVPSLGPVWGLRPPLRGPPV
jgi:hypothetical protein